MNKIQKQVEEFHRFYGVPVAARPAFPPPDRATLRVDLINEEAREFESAVAAGDLVEVADALGDLLYVVFGAGLEFGVDLELVVDEIHKSNLSKLGVDGKPVRAANGKILKGPNYRPPDVARVLVELKEK